jgi:hypothetical protein
MLSGYLLVYDKPPKPSGLEQQSWCFFGNVNGVNGKKNGFCSISLFFIVEIIEIFYFFIHFIPLFLGVDLLHIVLAKHGQNKEINKYQKKFQNKVFKFLHRQPCSSVEEKFTVCPGYHHLCFKSLCGLLSISLPLIL